jgi:hypothetical protein
MKNFKVTFYFVTSHNPKAAPTACFLLGAVAGDFKSRKPTKNSLFLGYFQLHII